MFAFETLETILATEYPQLQDRVSMLVRRFRANRPGDIMSQKDVATLCDIDEGRLSSILNPSKHTGTYSKEIQGRDIIKMLMKGVFTVAELKLNTKNKDEALLSQYGEIFEEPEILDMILRAKRLNMDIISILSPAIDAVEKASTDLLKLK